MAYGDTPEQAREKADHYIKLAARIVAGAVGLVVVVWLVVGIVGPKLNLYRAETERRAVIAEARAESEAAQFVAERQVEIAGSEAEADRIRAEGIADANAIISSSLTPEYIRWYFVDKLDDIDGQIIYLPTEAGVPLPEAGRAVAPEGEG